MFIYNESYNGNSSSSSVLSAGEITALAYEAILENVMAMGEAREQMIITEHEAIVNENTYILNEGIKDFLTNIKDKVVDLIKRFINWIDKATSELYYHVKASGNLKKHASEIAKSISGDYIRKAGIDVSNIKMRRFASASVISKLMGDTLNKYNDILNRRSALLDGGAASVAMAGDLKYANKFDGDTADYTSGFSDDLDKMDEAIKKMGLSGTGDNANEAIPATFDYLKNDTAGITSYVKGKPDISIKLIMGLKETRSNLKKAIPLVEKSSKAQEKISEVEEDKQEQTKAKNAQRALNLMATVLRQGLSTCNRLLVVAREKNAQLAKIAALYLKAYNKFMGGGKKQKDLKTNY